MAIDSMSNIKIHRTIPVVNGYVQLPNNKEKDRLAVTIAEALTVSGTILTRLNPDAGGASTAGAKLGTQEGIELPGIAVNAGSRDTVYEAVKALV